MAQPPSRFWRRPKLSCLRGFVILALALLAMVVTTPRALAADGPAKLRVLILSGLNNHDWRSTTPVIQRIFADSPRFAAADVTENPGELPPAAFARYDVLVCNWTPYPEPRRTWRPETETAFLDFVRKGGGFVVIHAAACSFQDWPEFQRLISLTWKSNYTAHGAYHTFKVSVEDSRHPITQGLSDFYTTDELYHRMVQITELPLHVVLKAFSAKDQAGTGNYEPVLVCRELGQGRGVNLVLGHDAPAMGAGFRTLLLRGAEWAATGKVTLPPPAIWPSTPAAMAAANIDIDATFRAVERYRFGDDRKPLHALQQLVMHAQSLAGHDPARFRDGLADRMEALLNSPEATPEARVALCGQLAEIGTEKQASALSVLLTNQPIVAAAALRALDRIPGSTVDRLLRDALGTAQGDLRVGVVVALGTRRDQAAMPLLLPLLAATNENLAAATAGALGQIGGDAAANALRQALPQAKGRLRAELADACLTCAERFLAEGQPASAAPLFLLLSGAGESEQVRMAAWRGTVRSNPAEGAGKVCASLAGGDAALENMALQLVPELPGTAATEQLAACLPKTPPQVQALLLRALAVRGDVAARPAVQAALSSEDPAVRLAAASALGNLGDDTSVKALLDLTSAERAPAERQAARDSLARLRGPRVNQALTSLLSLNDPGRQAEAIRVLAARGAIGSLAALEKAAGAPDPTVRKEAWKAMGRLAKVSDLAALLELLIGVREDDREEAEKALAAVLARPDPTGLSVVLRKLEEALSPSARASLIRLASGVGDDAALPALRKAVESGDVPVHDAAVRALVDWPTAAPFDDLVKVARADSEPVHRALALRAALRLSSKVVGRTSEQLASLLTQLMELAGTTAERKAVLSELGRCSTPEALRLAQQNLANPELAPEAGLALTQIASALRDQCRDEVLAALRRLLAGKPDATVAARAHKVLKDLLKPVNLSLGATVTSPDGLDPDGASGGDKAAIDGDPKTYWDEVDHADLYRLKVTLKEPQDVSSINILWHPHEQYQAKNLDVLCDGKVVAELRQAKCFDNEMFIAFPTVRCASVELVIPGKNGLVSPAIHEFQIFSRFPPPPGGAVP